MTTLIAVLFIGIGATALFDIWVRAVAALRGAPAPDWAPPGRWFAHIARGRVFHDSIAAAAPVRAEAAIGWAAHYAVGILFAAAVILWGGEAWLAAPTLGPPMIVGVTTVLAGWLLMNPGMGNGIAAARTPSPWTARALGLSAHAVFGLAMWVCALALGAGG